MSEEQKEIKDIFQRIRTAIGDSLKADDEQKLNTYIQRALENQKEKANDSFGLNPVLFAFQTAEIAIEEIGLRRDGVIAILLHNNVFLGDATIEELEHEFGTQVAHIIHGLCRIQELYDSGTSPLRGRLEGASENFRNLLISFAEDMRVILIMIAHCVNLMRQIKDSNNNEARQEVAKEAALLYAPLAHKLGLYKLKSELEDLSLKYLEHDAYYLIKEKLNATKRSRDAYIDRFISPIEERLQQAGLHFHMKGRTKSIHSIWQKMKKQKCGFEGVYDLFAIRIILDSPIEKEKMHCWQAFSIVTDMYQPNPKRLRDWLSVPKSNGYESLHITVLGPENKWVEVQIRTERMDEVAEKGLAAHWRYKGIKGGNGGIDEWLGNIRAALEASDDGQLLDNFKMDLYEDEVYVFSPKGDLFKFPKGATILDFAYHVHTNVGNACVGGRINGKAVSFKYQLHSGDTVEIITQSNQSPKQDWVNIVKTSRAKAKIRQALKETQVKDGILAKEMLARRFKNRKIELDESILNNAIKKLGFKETSDFYRQLVDEKIDLNDVIEKYLQLRDHELNGSNLPIRSAEEFEYENPEEELMRNNDDVLVIDKDVKGLQYQLAKCCHPIYGDQVFGFVTQGGGIKIHRTDCPNAPQLRKKYSYRILKAKWSGKGTSQYGITLKIIGNDDLGIVNNITSIISKEEKIIMRSINIDSHDGLFNGTLVVMLEDTSRLEALIKKLRTVKGVKQVARI